VGVQAGVEARRARLREQLAAPVFESSKMDTAGGKKRGSDPAAADDQNPVKRERGDPDRRSAGHGGGSCGVEEDPGLEQGLAALLETAGGASVDRSRQVTVSPKSYILTRGKYTGLMTLENVSRQLTALLELERRCKLFKAKS